MASSSLSQESLDKEEYEYSARRSRIKALRTRGGSSSSSQHKTAGEYMDSAQAPPSQYSSSTGGATTQALGGASGTSENPQDLTAAAGVNKGKMLGTPTPQGPDESPTRCSAAARLKDKRTRPNHLHKGKTAKDKRKLREKRRSTGVVHLPSTESTGDSLDDDDNLETRRNTSHNEIIDADNPETPDDDRIARIARNHRNRSPSDLEADFEDNQDYDSAVSQSDTNLTTIGQGSPTPLPSLNSSRLRSRIPAEGAKLNNSSHAAAEDGFTRPVSYPSRFREHDPEFENLHLHATHNNHVQSRLNNGSSGHHHHHYHHHRPSLRDYRGSSLDSAAESSSKLIAKNKDLERQLEFEREERQRVEDLLVERDDKIAQLEREINLLHTDLEMVDEENEKLQKENRVLLHAMQALKLT